MSESNAEAVYRSHFTSYIPLIVYVGFALLMVIVALFSYLALEEGIKKEKLQDLAVIAESKVEQVVSWQIKQQQLGTLMMRDDALVERMLSLQQRNNVQDERALQQRLQHWMRVGDFDSIVLLDKQGAILVSSQPDVVLDDTDGSLLNRVGTQREIVFSDWHDGANNDIHLDVVLPLYLAEQWVGVAVLQASPRRELQKLAQSWVVHRLQSAEIWLTHLEQGKVVLQPTAAQYVAHGMDVTGLEQLATILQGQAANLVTSVSYRGQQALLAVRKVPETSWFMLVKVDKNELFSPINQLERWTRFLWGAFALFGGVLFFVWFNGIRVQRDMLQKREMLIKHFEYLSKYASDLVVVMDKQGNVLEVNERALQVLGYQRNEMLKMNFVDFCPEVALDFAEDELFCESFYRCKNGHVVAVELCIRIVETDGVRCLHNIARDITERRRADFELRQQKNFTLQIVDSVPSSIFVTDAAGRFLLVNQFLANLYELKPEQLVGLKDAELFLQPEQIRRHLAMERRVIDTRLPVEFIEYSLVAGQEKWLRFIKVPMPQQDAGCHVLSVGIDITELKQTELVLHQQRKFTLQILDTLPDYIFVTDAKGVLLIVNQAAAKLHDMKQDELAGQGCEILMWMSVLSDQHEKADQYVLKKRHTYQFTGYCVMRGQACWLHFTKVPMLQADGGAHILNVVVDISERKQFEAMRANMEHIGRLNIAGELASGLAHELSQPLTAGNNYLEGCLRRVHDENWDREKFGQGLLLAQRQIERAGAIVNHLKNMVKKQGYEYVLVDLNELSKDMLSFLDDEIHNLAVEVRCDFDNLPLVYLCKVEVEQVLLNLYKNALDSMRHVVVRELTVTTKCLSADRIQISVRDSGKGVSPEHMMGLFSPFNTTKNDGLGLGLVICRSFVEKHGGQIWVNPQCEQGAEFCFTLSMKSRS